MADKPCTELPHPEAAVLPALVSVSDLEVTSLGHFIHSTFADQNEQGPVHMGMCCLPASHTFQQRTKSLAAISPYETRSSGYRSHTDFRGSAPSLQSLTGKRSLTFSIAPFMVELFAFKRFV